MRKVKQKDIKKETEKQIIKVKQCISNFLKEHKSEQKQETRVVGG